jgi:hypothetical protein
MSNRALNPNTLKRVRLIILGLESNLERMTTGNLAHERNCCLGMVDGLKHWADEAVKPARKRKPVEPSR